MSDQRTRRWDAAAKWSVWVAAGLSMGLLLLDRTRLGHPDFHPHFEGERWFGFYAGLSSISCLALAALAAAVRAVRTGSVDSEDEWS